MTAIGLEAPRRRARSPVAAVFARALEGEEAADDELFELAQDSDEAVDALAALAGAEIARERRELGGPPAWELAQCDQVIAAVRDALGWTSS